MKINPVLFKEVKVRIRGWKAVGMVVLYLTILTLVAVLIMYEGQNSLYSSTIDPAKTIGSYTTLALIQFILILFVAPALTSGAISGEREKQTIDLMLCTKLSPFSIIIGKLLASISQILLLIVGSLPIFSVIFLYGGISILEVFQLFLFYLVTAFAAGAIGIFYSSYMKKTTGATVMTYGTGAFMILGTLFITLFYIEVIMSGNYKAVFPLLYTNPLVGFGSLLMEQFGYEANVLSAIAQITGSNAGILKNISPWIINVAFDILLSIVLILLSARKINPIKKKIVLFRKK